MGGIFSTQPPAHPSYYFTEDTVSVKSFDYPSVRYIHPGYMFTDDNTHNLTYLPLFKSECAKNVELKAIDAQEGVLEWIHSETEKEWMERWKSYDDIFVWKSGVCVIRLCLRSIPNTGNILKVTISNNK